MLNALITRQDNAVPDRSENRHPFLKKSTTLSAQFGILFTIIMTVSVSLCLHNQSLFRTTWKVLSLKRLTIIQRGASPRLIQDQKYFDDEGKFTWVRISDVTASNHYLETTTQHLSELGASFSICLQPNQLFLSIALLAQLVSR